MALDRAVLLRIHELMLRSRLLEERLIRVYKAGHGFFWIGSPGEEAFGVPLGMLVRKGQGAGFDWLHLHYRATPTLVALGMAMEDGLRLMANRKTDPSTAGRNFSGHYAFPEWNVAPVSSTIGVQYVQALGTAHVQKREGLGALTVVSGGDAGTAEGDFASCLVWASRPGQELPLLITVQNNRWGISTSYEGQHGEEKILDRARAFGIEGREIDGNDPVETYSVLREEVEAIRKDGKPRFVEARVSRLYGHSSASGANRVEGEVDCLGEFEARLIEQGILNLQKVKELQLTYEAEGKAAQEKVLREAVPSGEDIWQHVWADDTPADWRRY